MLESIVNNIKNHVVNLPGWRTNRKIVVFESDDWGMIRMASKEAYNWFLRRGYNVDQCHYNQNDAIESNKDLELLFEVLCSVKDSRGNAAVFTANNIVANPDFSKIRESGFRKYYFEPFTITLKQYPGRERVVELYKQGMAQKIFRPQFHGREHLNVNNWMDRLNSGNKIFQDAFKQNMFAVHKSGNNSGRRYCLDTFGMGGKKEWVNINESIQSGLDLFEDLWGYRSSSFIAPCYVWPSEIEGILAENGIKYIQGTRVQRVPFQNGNQSIKKKYHYLGQENKFGQRYLVRNVHFEPTENSSSDPIDRAMNEIKIAFRYNKPAIISSHRVNYMGSIKSKNRDRGLKLLGILLKKIVEKYPEVEFMSSDQLGELIDEG